MNLNLSPIQDELNKLEAVRQAINNKMIALRAENLNEAGDTLTEAENDTMDLVWLEKMLLLRQLSEIIK